MWFRIPVEEADGALSWNLAESIGTADEIWQRTLNRIGRKEDFSERLPERVQASGEMENLKKIDLPLVQLHMILFVEIDEPGVERSMVRRR